MPEPAREAVRVICPGCKMIMVATDRRPVDFSSGLVQVIYRCESCGTQTTRAIKDT
jgi:RNase P subunit RPR2